MPKESANKQDHIKMRQLWILVGATFAVCNFVESQETGRNLYSLRYDYLNVESILSSSRLVTNYVDCLLSKKPCPPEGKDLKRILPEALRTKCGRCSPKQKENALKIIRTLYENYPNQYQALRAKWDQTGEYHRRFEQYLREEQFNTINSNDRRPRPTQSRPVSNAGVDTNSVDQSQVNIQRIPPNPLAAQPTTQRVFTPRPAVVTQPPQTQRPAPTVQPLRPVQSQNQIPAITRVVTQQQQQPSTNNGNNAQNNAPAQNSVPIADTLTQRPDRSPAVAQNTNQNAVPVSQPAQPEPTFDLSSRFADDVDDEDEQPAAPAPAANRVPVMQAAPVAPASTANTNQNTQNTYNDGLVNINDIRTPSTSIKTSATVVGIPPNIIDNFFVPPSNTYQPQTVRPIQGLFNRIGTKVANTAAFVGGMLRATVQVFVGNRPQQQQQFQ